MGKPSIHSIVHRCLTEVMPGLVILVGLGCGAVAVWWTPAKGESFKQKNPPEIQEERRTVDCGAVSLYIICRLAEKDCSLEELRQLTHTSSLGTDMLELKNAAMTVGFDVQAVACSFEQVQEHVAKKGQYAVLHSRKTHFLAAIGGASRGKLRLVDPVFGVEDLMEEEVRAGVGWEGAVLLLTAKTDINE